MRCLLATLFLFAFIELTAQQKIADFKVEPTLHWKFRINAPIIASPVVSDNLVYFGGLDSVLYALDHTSGKQIWKFRTRGQIRSTILVNGAVLYLNGGDGSLYSLDKKTGKVKWTFTGKGERKYDFADYHQSSPVLYNNTLYFGSGNDVYAVHAEKGTQAWSYRTGDVVHGTPALDNNKLFVGSFDGNVYALNAADGSLIWKFKTVGHRFFPKGEVQGSPSIFKGQVFIGARD